MKWRTTHFDASTDGKKADLIPPLEGIQSFKFYPKSLATMPLWIHFLGYRFLSGFTTDETLAVRVPFWNILRTLLLTLAPLILGVIIAKYLPEYANRARRVRFSCDFAEWTVSWSLLDAFSLLGRL